MRSFPGTSPLFTGLETSDHYLSDGDLIITSLLLTGIRYCVRFLNPKSPVISNCSIKRERSIQYPSRLTDFVHCHHWCRLLMMVIINQYAIAN